MEFVDFLLAHDSYLIILCLLGLLLGFRSLPSTLKEVRDFIKEVREALIGK